jgi:hypothetical protein
LFSLPKAAIRSEKQREAGDVPGDISPVEIAQSADHAVLLCCAATI